MKRICFVIAMVVMSMAGLAQGNAGAEADDCEYVGMVKEGYVWEYGWQEWMINRGIVRFELSGDAVIDGKEYKKCYRYTTESLDMGSAELAGYMREEDRVVYAIATDNKFTGGVMPYDIGHEYVAYNFSGENAGDKVLLFSGFYDSYWSRVEGWLDETGVLATESGLRKRFVYSVDLGMPGLQLVDQLGYLDYQHGSFILPNPFYIVGSTDAYHATLMSVKRTDGNFVWKCDNYDSRIQYYASVATSLASGLAVKVSGGQLTVEPGSRECSRIELADISGKKVLTAAFWQGEAAISVPVDGLACGMYVLTVVYADGSRASQKMLLK